MGKVLLGLGLLSLISSPIIMLFSRRGPQQRTQVSQSKLQYEEFFCLILHENSVFRQQILPDQWSEGSGLMPTYTIQILLLQWMAYIYICDNYLSYTQNKLVC